MTLHYLNKVPRAASSGRANRKIREEAAARLLAWSREQTAAGVWSRQHGAHAGTKHGRQNPAAFMGLVGDPVEAGGGGESQLAREWCSGCEAQTEGLHGYVG